MSKLSVDQKSIFELFSDKKSYFLIPDYQRPYAWSKDECETLWNDIVDFAIPDDDYSKFNDNDEYYLGPIVTFDNNSKMEVIDGQQRLTTLMLLLRAFYGRFGSKQDLNSVKTREALEKCIWKTDAFGTPDKNELKIDSEVATDTAKEEFLDILRNGIAPDTMKSGYAENFRYFEKWIDEFSRKYDGYLSFLAIRVLNNCILLPIEAETQDSALRIFSTLNDRGLPLSDADIFKSELYKFYSKSGKKDEFINRWKVLEEKCEKLFHPITGTPMDDLFTRYMYFERAKLGEKSSTTEALRKFYEKNSYKLLQKEETFDNLEKLADFWEDIANQNRERFSEKVLRWLFILNYAPNGMWTYIVSVYFLQNKNASNMLDDEAFFRFLVKITAFVFVYSFVHPGVNALRTPVFAEMINIISGKSVEFSNYSFDENEISTILKSYEFLNTRPITKSMLAWWALQNESQEIPELTTIFEIEHIFAKNRDKKEDSLTNKKNLESLGNKSLLEKGINIKASDYRFSDKLGYYKGMPNARSERKRAGTQIRELRDFAENKKADFTESDIEARKNDMINKFIEFERCNGLIK